MPFSVFDRWHNADTGLGVPPEDVASISWAEPGDGYVLHRTAWPRFAVMYNEEPMSLDEFLDAFDVATLHDPHVVLHAKAKHVRPRKRPGAPPKHGFYSMEAVCMCTSELAAFWKHGGEVVRHNGPAVRVAPLRPVPWPPVVVPADGDPMTTGTQRV